MPKVIICDLDNTLVKAWTSDFLPGVAEWFGQNQVPVVLATNQGGPTLRSWMETAGFGKPEELPTLGDVLDRTRKVSTLLPIERAYISLAYKTKDGKFAPLPDFADYDVWKDGQLRYSYDPLWRKPDPKMLLQILADYKCNPLDALFIGDDWGADFPASMRANIPFMQAWAVFGWPDPNGRKPQRQTAKVDPQVIPGHPDNGGHS